MTNWSGATSISGPLKVSIWAHRNATNTSRCVLVMYVLEMPISRLMKRFTVAAPISVIKSLHVIATPKLYSSVMATAGDPFGIVCDIDAEYIC